jgi:uncharacterized protein YprB with RNaseH-like and TPR domain
MLKNTFLHAPGIGRGLEKQLWHAGIASWQDLLSAHPSHLPLGARKRDSLTQCIGQSIVHLENNDPHFFAESLPSHESWRLFPEFRSTVAYLDIETTGMGTFNDHITTISIYDGTSIFTYVHGENLHAFRDCIDNYRVIVTYNGKCFDIPFIRDFLGIPMNQVHIDLRYVLRSLGHGGGLKGCERQLGLERGDLDGVDGFFAVLLWDDYRRTGNRKALETLLAYNVMDVVNLETLMVTAYNLKLQSTPFQRGHRLEMPEPPGSPFEPDVYTIRRMRERLVGHL